MRNDRDSKVESPVWLRGGAASSAGSMTG